MECPIFRKKKISKYKTIILRKDRMIDNLNVILHKISLMVNDYESFSVWFGPITENII